jgi:hypothetical protein
VESSVAELLKKASSLVVREAPRFVSSCATGLAGGSSTSDAVALMRCAPVVAGEIARVQVQVTNDTDAPSQVALYASNFIADLGYEIPSWRVTFSPRGVAIDPHSALPFEVAVAVPEQTPPGTYSGLIQAVGQRTFRAVLTLDVL